MKHQLGRPVFGSAGIAFGLIILNWHQIPELGNISQPAILVYAIGVLEIAGGLSLFWKGTIRFGAILLGVIFLIFTFYWLPQIIRSPLVFGYWGNSLEQFSIALGCAFIFATTIKSRPGTAVKILRTAYLCYGICVISYALYQLLYLTYTANLVPQWIPPGQMFWAVFTTVAFALAAISLLSGRKALLASRLLTVMLIGFGLLIWVPACVTDPHKFSNWVENASNLAMAGSAWIVSDFLYRSKAGLFKDNL
jgi:hypothetical protein